MGAYSSTPTVVRSWEEGDRNGKFIRARKILTLTIASQGGVTNNISAAALGFATGGIDSVILVSFTDTGPQNRGILVWTNGSLVILGDPQVGTDADRCEPIDLSGTLTIEIAGRPA